VQISDEMVSAYCVIVPVFLDLFVSFLQMAFNPKGIEGGLKPSAASATSLKSTFRAKTVSGPAVYHLGIVDFLQDWTFKKRLERAFKIYFTRKDPDGLSVMRPDAYQRRFQGKMEQIFDLDGVGGGVGYSKEAVSHDTSKMSSIRASGSNTSNTSDSHSSVLSAPVIIFDSGVSISSALDSDVALKKKAAGNKREEEVINPLLRQTSTASGPIKPRKDISVVPPFDVEVSSIADPQGDSLDVLSDNPGDAKVE
jgi:hypothetical protein